ncbi:hypothetical protein OF66_2742 [Seleniivibrio woodruffii]|uniref:Membrane associated rhomboid family serine protease n=1 Tax=Seleniivibrio woodruffii TaxID=1078050 RepID=A0A4R1KEH1_9BACT|nr:membrane associated rhomboid family serine protease [Seleniivibrio woodruffii]TVZ37093.1 hypothetical protein OF66_2742 [Seleniivibrio woodruffii]
MFPLSDSFKTGIFPVVTLGIILINVFVFWIMYMGVNAQPNYFIGHYGLIPRELFMPSEVLPFSEKMQSVIAHMFMHGGFMHIFGNMYFLYIFGDNVEERMGHFGFALMYLVFGLAAAGVQVFTDPASGIPMVGASGALAGVMGAYWVFFPRSHIRTLILFPFSVINIPAFIYLFLWLGLQFFGLLGGGSSIAFMAHIGGFLAGVLSALIYKSVGTAPRRRYQRY